MTPRQKKRQARASAKGRPLAFIRFRAVAAKYQESVTAAFVEILDGRRKMAEIMRDHIRSTLVDMVLRPIVRRVVRDMAGVIA